MRELYWNIFTVLEEAQSTGKSCRGSETGIETTLY